MLKMGWRQEKGSLIGNHAKGTSIATDGFCSVDASWTRRRYSTALRIYYISKGWRPNGNPYEGSIAFDRGSRSRKRRTGDN